MEAAENHMAARKARTGMKDRGVAAKRTRVRKNLEVDPVKLRGVKKLLGAKTAAEAVDRALSEIIFEHRVAQGLERLAATGGLPCVDPAA